MNKRIRELAKDAGVEIYQIDAGYGIITKTVLYDEDIEKFAKLMVKECGKYLMRDEFIGRSDLDWSMVLNEHFGIE